MPLDDRAEDLLLLPLHQAGACRDDAEGDHRGQEIADAAQIGTAPGRDHGGDEIAGDDQLHGRHEPGDDLRRERGDETPGGSLPDDAER